MNQSVRSSVGKWMYDLIWNTRKGDNKWGWLVVFFINFIQLIWIPCVLASILYYLFPPKFDFEVVMVWQILFAPLIVTVLSTNMAFSRTSNFIAVAGDMNRLYCDPASNLLTKVLAKLLYLISGVLAIYLAYMIWWVNRDRLKELGLSQLDVLGNAFAHGKFFWLEAKFIFYDLQHVYGSRNNSKLTEEQKKEISVFFAYACKWMSLEPGTSKEHRKYLFSVRYDTLKEYPDLPIEVTMRIREDLPLINIEA